MKVIRNQGALLQIQQLTRAPSDGIHVDMDRLKKGEVKYEALFPFYRSVLTVFTASERRCKLKLDVNNPNLRTNTNQHGDQLQGRCYSWFVLREGYLNLEKEADDGGITGADSRTTTGSYIANRVTDKLTQVHDTIWCCRSGSAADTQAVADIVHYQLGMYGVQNGRQPTTQTAAAMFQELCYENKDRLR